MVTVIYWLFAIVGMVDIDVFHLGTDLHVHTDLDVHGDLHVDTDLEGLTGLAGLMVTLGLTGVPMTVVITVLALLGWLISYFVVLFLFAWVPGGLLTYVLGTIEIPLVLALSVPLTAQAIKPLRPLFRRAYAQAPQKVLLGQVCVVRSSRVDESFGEATAVIEGASLILKVRAEPAKQLKKGDRVVMIEYQAEQNSYRVVPEHEFSQ